MMHLVCIKIRPLELMPWMMWCWSMNFHQLPHHCRRIPRKLMMHRIVSCADHRPSSADAKAVQQCSAMDAGMRAAFVLMLTVLNPSLGPRLSFCPLVEVVQLNPMTALMM